MTDVAAHNRHIASQRMNKLAGLLDNPDFVWFLRECVVKEQTRLDEIVHDRTKAEEHANALSEWCALKRVREWVELEANDVRKTLGHTTAPIVLDLSEPKQPSAP